MKKLTISIGIPTYEAGNGLVVTLDSIYAQTFISKVSEILLVVDGNQISKEVLSKIKNKKLRIKYSRVRKGQSARINDILKELNTDLVVLTNDDVILDKKAIEEIFQCAQKSEIDLLAGCVKPLTLNNNILVKILNVGVDINHIIYERWNMGDNYLGYNGRILCISKKLKESLTLPEKIWNNDAYIYLYSLLHGFKCKHIENSICYYILPSTLNDYFKQTNKFQISKTENEHYFKLDLSRFYTIPKFILLQTITSSFLQKPFLTISYILVRLLSKRKVTLNRNHVGYWKTDKSTKELKSI